jgi:hypothetical protein
MVFASSVTKETVFGNMRVRMGTFTQESNTTGGDIKTGLNTVASILVQPKGSAVTANSAVVNETLPLAGGDVTIVTDADVDGTWIAYGD